MSERVEVNSKLIYLVLAAVIANMGQQYWRSQDSNDERISAEVTQDHRITQAETQIDNLYESMNVISAVVARGILPESERRISGLESRMDSKLDKIETKLDKLYEELIN